MREHVSQSKKATTASFSIPSLKHRIPGFGLDSPQASPQAVPLVQPLHKPLTHDISRIPLRNPQAKLSISQPGDKYEQEADSVAQQVMQRIAQPVNRQSFQPQGLPEGEELQMKPMANSIRPLQRQEIPESESELQMKSLDNSTLQRQEAPEDEEELQMKSMVQRRAEARMADAPDLEASINQARGGGQAMADNIRYPMEQAFGTDFSGVKVHTDGQSDQLNRSIQARAFTTGQDVFFRQGEYNPGSRGGQELLAHELTHVVQQNGGAVQRSPLTSKTSSPNTAIGGTLIQGAAIIVQRAPKTWMQERGYKSRQDVIDAIDRLFEQNSKNEAHALLNEYNNQTPNKLQKIATNLISHYSEPKDKEMQAQIVKSSGERRYLKDSDVAIGDLVYGLGEQRDKYIDTNKKSYNVIDELNNQFIGTQKGNKYGLENIAAENEASKDAATGFQQFLGQFKPEKAPQKTPQGDDVSINTRLRRASKYGISYTRNKNNKIRFALDELIQDDVVKKNQKYDTGSDANKEKMRSITGAELRYIYRKRNEPEFMAGIEFFKDGHKLETTPWEDNPELWDEYVPEGEKTIKWMLIRAVEQNVNRVMKSLPPAIITEFRNYSRTYIQEFIQIFDAHYANTNIEHEETYNRIVEGMYNQFIQKLSSEAHN